jgi:serine/threonine-protein kinase
MADDPLIGALFAGRFRIEAPLGTGGMATVYLARHEILRRPVALKLLRAKLLADLKIMSRFQREARAASLIEHPHLTQIYDFGSDEDGTPYLAMEYAEGPSLAEALAEAGPLPPGRALDVLAQIAEALQAVHEAGVVHRDLKPTNVVLTVGPDDNPDHVKVLDFGMAKIFGPEETTSLSTMGFTYGTPKYMSPEQISGEALDHRSDQYSLGVIAYELLTGEVPFDGKMVEVMEAHLKQQPEPPSEVADREDISAELDDLVLRCLAKRAEERYLNAAHLLEALRALACC